MRRCCAFCIVHLFNSIKNGKETIFLPGKFDLCFVKHDKEIKIRPLLNEYVLDCAKQNKETAVQLTL